MAKIVTMLIICWTASPSGQLQEAWRIEDQVSLSRCLTMNRVFSGGGNAGAITVRCGGIHDEAHP